MVYTVANCECHLLTVKLCTVKLCTVKLCTVTLCTVTLCTVTFSIFAPLFTTALAFINFTVKYQKYGCNTTKVCSCELKEADLKKSVYMKNPRGLICYYESGVYFRSDTGAIGSMWVLQLEFFSSRVHTLQVNFKSHSLIEQQLKMLKNKTFQ